MAHLGHYISGLGHVGLISYVLVGPLFSSEPLPFEVANVSIVTSAEFSALTEQPTQVALPSAPQAPEIPEETAPDIAPALDAPREGLAPPPPPQPTAPEAAVAPPPPPPPAPVTPPQTDAPALVTPEALEVPDAPVVAEQPQQRPSERIAPTPVAPPEPDATIAQERQEAVVPEESDTQAEAAQEPQEATAPEEAASEIVTEAEEGPASAPERSVRPQSRPSQLTANVPEPEPQEQQVDAAPEETAETPPPSPNVDTATAIENALREALGGAIPDTTASPAVPEGPPLTAGEREGLVLAVQSCWIIDPGSPASEVVVTVAMSLTQEGRIEGDVRRVSAQGGDARAQDVAFQAARRAVLRCGANGFPLPPEKYAQWQEVEMTFNPETMRIR